MERGCKCPKCGKYSMVCEDDALLPFPPRYSFKCEHCDYEGVVSASDVVWVYDIDSGNDGKYIDILNKKVKAFDIINEKRVNISSLDCAETVEQYNVKENSLIPLTEDDFIFLKLMTKIRG